MPDDGAAAPFVAQPEQASAGPSTAGPVEGMTVHDNLDILDALIQKLDSDDIPENTRERLLKLRRLCDDRIEGMDQSRHALPSFNREQGAIPKRRNPRSSRLDGEVPNISNHRGASAELSSDSSSDSEGDKPGRLPPKTERRSSECSSYSESNYVQRGELIDAFRAMMELGGRRAPTIAPYEEDSGVNLRQYLEEFELHCRENVRGNQKFWIGELQSKLSGETLRAYKSIQRKGDTWEAFVDRLVNWYETDSIARKNRFRKVFQSVTRESGEGLFLLATRLEKLFRVAYPNKAANSSKTLMDKFVAIVPEEIATIIKSKRVSKRSKNSVLTWEKMLGLIRACDAEPRQSKDSEIVINVGTGNPIHSDRTPRYREKNVVSELGENSPVARAHGSPSPQDLQNQGNKCHYCGKTGHFIGQCRLKNRECFACGSRTHFIADCQSRFEQKNSESPRRKYYPASRLRSPQRYDNYQGRDNGVQYENQGQGYSSPRASFNRQRPNYDNYHDSRRVDSSPKRATPRSTGESDQNLVHPKGSALVQWEDDQRQTSFPPASPNAHSYPA